MKLEQTPDIIDWPSEDGPLVAETQFGFNYKLKLTRNNVSMRVSASELRVILQAIGWLK